MTLPFRFIVSLAALAAAPVLAQTNTWTNTASGNWNSAANWTPGVPVSSSNTVLQFNNSGSTTLRATNNLGTFTLNRLILNSSSTGGTFLSGNALAFRRTGGTLPQILQNGSGAITIQTAVSADTNLTFAGSGTGAVTVSGVISSNINLIKTGNHVLTLSGANTFGGTGRTVTIAGGTLAINANNGLGSTASTVLISNNAVLRFNGSFTHNRVVNLGAGGGRIEVTGANTVTHSVALANATTNTFTKDGTGNLILTAASTRSNSLTVINGGRLQLNVTNALGLITTNTVVRVDSGSLVYNNAQPLRYHVVLNGGTLEATRGTAANDAGAVRTILGRVTAASGTTSTVSLQDPLFPANSTAYLITGVLAGDGNLVIDSPLGGGFFRLTNNANTFTGVITVGTNAVLIVGHTNGTPLNSASLVLHDGALVNFRYGFTNNANIGHFFSNSNNITVLGNVTVDVRRPLNVGAGNTHLFGSLNLTNGRLNLTGANTYAAKFGAPGSISGNAVLNVNGAVLSIDAPLSDGATPGSLTKTGPTTLLMTNLAENSFSGGFTIQQGRFVADAAAMNSTILGAQSLVRMQGGNLSIRTDVPGLILGPGSGYDLLVESNAVLELNRRTNTALTASFQIHSITNFAGLTTTHSNGSNLRIVGPVHIGASNAFFAFGGVTVLNGLISDGGAGYVFEKRGNGRLSLTNFVTQDYSGGTIIRAGQVQIAATNGLSPNEPLGPGDITMFGGSLELRGGAGTQQYGPGAGYAVTVNGNSTISADRAGGLTTTAGTAQLRTLTNNGATVTVTSGNSYTLSVAGPAVINGFSSFNTGNSGNQFTLMFTGGVTEGAPGAVLRKTGAGTLMHTNAGDLNWTGGTIIDQGRFVWRPAAAEPLALSIGTGPITLDGGGILSLQSGVSVTNEVLNDIIANGVMARGGITNFGGGLIEFRRLASNPVTVLSGDIALRGPLTFFHTNAGASTPGILGGNISVEGGDRRLIALGSGGAGDFRIVVNGDIGGDGSPRTLELIANNRGSIELNGNNSDLASIRVKPAFVGTTGRVRFTTTNALPSGLVTVESGALVGIGFPLADIGGFTNLASRFDFQPNAILGLDNDPFLNNTAIDLSATGLNRDVRIGNASPVTMTNRAAWTPFATEYKLGGGFGNMVLNGTNQFTGANSLSVGPVPFAAPIDNAPASTVTFASTSSNSYTGGTVVNDGTLAIQRAAGGRSLGTGPVRVYGTLSATGGAGSLADAGGSGAAYDVTLQPGGILVLGDNNSYVSNRWGDAAPIALNGSRLNYNGRNLAIFTSTETVGPVSVRMGSLLNVIANANTANSAVHLTAADLVRDGTGTLELLQSANTAPTVNNTDFGAQSRFLLTSAPAMTNGIVAPWMVNNTARSHLTYDPVLGFTNATYSLNTLNSQFAGTAVVDQAATTLTGNPVVHALRLNGVLNAGGGGANTVTIRSGGLISPGTTGTDANLVFNDGGQDIEALFYNEGTFTNRGQLTAAGVTKFGGGTLLLAANQGTYAGGWNINRGAISATGTPTAAGGTNFALGQASGGNPVNLNGPAATLNFTGVGTNITYASGKITVLDNGVITHNAGGGNGVVQTIAPLGLDFDSFSNGTLGAQARIDIAQSRNLLQVGGPVTLLADAALQVRNTGAANGNSGGSNRIDFAGGLIGNNRTLIKWGNGILGLPTDNSASFLGSIDVRGGTLAVGHNGSPGNIFSTAEIRSGAVLELLAPVVDFTPVAMLVQQPGSAERWQSELARFADFATPATNVMPAGVHLQIAAGMINLTNKTIRLNGGTIEGYNYIDDTRTGVHSNILVGRGIAIQLGADSRIGSSGVDPGKGGLIFSNLATITDFGGSRSLTKIGPETVVLGAQNTYGGGTIVEQGILRIATNDALLPSGPLTIAAGGVFDLGGFNQTVGGLSGGGVLTNGATNRVLTANVAGSNVFSGVIHGGVDLVKGGVGTLTLSGASPAAGSRQVFDGILYVDGPATATSSPLGMPTSGVSLLGLTVDAQLLTKGPWTVPQSITVEGNFGFGGSKVIGGATSDASTFTGNLILFDNVALTAAAGGNVNFSGTITQSGGEFGIVKTGDGTVNLTGAGNFTGQTTVAAGRLLVNNPSVSATGSGLVMVEPGAMLGGNGRIGGSLFINDDGAISPGNSIGALRVDGDLSFSSLAGVTFEIGGLMATNEHDAISVGGDVFLGGTLSLALTNSYWPTTNSSYTLISHASNGGGTRFDNALNGARVTTLDQFGSFRINYSGTNVVAGAFQYFDNTGDGIFDAWAMKYFGLLHLPDGTGPADKFGDADGDGMNNWQEFIAGTIPTDPGSRLELTSAQVIEGTANFAVRWPLADETTFRTPAYQIQYSSDLVNWLTVANPSPLNFAEPGFAEWIDDGSLTGGTPPLNLSTPRFYRVVAQ